MTKDYFIRQYRRHSGTFSSLVIVYAFLVGGMVISASLIV